MTRNASAERQAVTATFFSSSNIIPHGGHVRDLAGKASCSEDELIDFSANINPFGPPESLRATISRTLDKVIHYPDRDNSDLTSAIASVHKCKCEHVLAANGSTELLYALPRALPCTRAFIPVPSYSDYTAAFRGAGIPVETLTLSSANNFLFDIEELAKSFAGGELVIFGQPNNPTGQLVERTSIVRAAKRATSTHFVVDESFADFVDGYVSLISEEMPNVIVIKSLTKFYAIPGLRLGFVHAATPLISALRACLPVWSVNVFAQAVGAECLRNNEYATRTRQMVRANLHRQIRRLNVIEGIRVHNACTNFLLLSIIKQGWDALALSDALLKRRIAVRSCNSFEGLDEKYLRIAIRSDKENQLIASHIAEILNKKQIRVKKVRPTPAIMFQGTCSNAGKSVLTAAMCRVMVQDGITVAPFKAQNMSLNSFVTADGGEMGRAQVVQAQACRLAPDIRMNPILLKPSGDTGSQIIVNGRPIGPMGVSQYFKYKATAFEIVKQSYDSLAKEFGTIVLEGAGSPAEVNLKHHDVVNMRMASYAQSPVLIVGDIDKGGVFASFIGTMETFEPWERKLVAGFIVNRFRGDTSQLNSAFDYTLRHTGKPVLGVIRHISNLGLPEEDSVTFKLGKSLWNNDGDRPITIGIVDLPHISNFTDFDALRLETDVSLRIVRTAPDLDNLEALIIPGSKNVPSDMAWLRTSQIAAGLIELAHKGCTDIIGICGGFQILGKSISDPHMVESGGGESAGLALLDICTTLGQDKILKRTEATHTISGYKVSGYEIHHGRTTTDGASVLIVNDNNEPVGVGSGDHRIWGTYLHGVFDCDEFRRWFVNRLRKSKGLGPLGVTSCYDIEPALDRLADAFRESVDVKNLYRLMGL